MHKTFRSFTYSESKFLPEPTRLLMESPLEISINDQRQIIIMVTPQQIKELVVGFIFTEGHIETISEINSCEIATTQKKDGEQILSAKVAIATKGPNLMTSGKRISYSSCGICGTENYYNLKNGLSRVTSKHHFSMEMISKFVSRMQEFQPLYRKTGGSHAAILFSRTGNPVLHLEDMGRHNALDKVIGQTLIEGINRNDKIIFSSGRASLEMILKTARAGFPVFVAKSRPTSKAVEAAKFFNITLIDLAKNTNRVYTHARRLEGF